jgi:hypothetical protein
MGSPREDRLDFDRKFYRRYQWLLIRIIADMMGSLLKINICILDYNFFAYPL